MRMSKLQFRIKYGEGESAVLEKQGWEIVPCDGKCSDGLQKCPGWRWHKPPPPGEISPP